MMDKSIGSEKTIGGGLEEIQSPGDVLTQRQRKRFKTGDTLLGRYRILGELGQGGMGLVFRCLDETGGIEVAVKMLPPEVSHDSGEMEEVRENFALVANLAHPNIATVRTLEKDPATGEYFLVMELAQGVNLRQWRKAEVRGRMSDVRGSDGRAGPPDPPKPGAPGGRALPEILAIIRQIAAALDYAHEHKVIHRDIKPSNVMVDTSAFGLQSSACTVKVLDFGLAAQIHTSFSRISQVRYGTSGTGPYMAPEQWRGEYQDGATDQYALAVLAYELIAGHCPFESHETTVLKQAVLDNEPKRPAGLPETAWQALKRGLAKERDARFASCGEFAAALGGDKEKLRNTRIARKGTANGRKWTRIAAGMLVLAALAAAGWGAWRSIQEAVFRSQNGADGAGTASLPSGGTSSRDTVGQGGDLADSGSAGGPGGDRADSGSETAPGPAPGTTKADAIPAQSAALYVWKQVQDYGREQGMGQRLNAAELALNTASNFFQAEEYDRAKSGYEVVIRQIEELKQRQAARQAALSATNALAAARAAAEAADAQQWAASYWRGGGELAASGSSAFETGDFEKARGNWTQAADQYRQAAEKVPEAKLADALGKARAEQQAGNWDEALAQAKTALALEPGSAEAGQIQTAAEIQLKPKVKIQATAGGKSVAATVSDGGRGRWTTPTAEITLKKGSRYAFTVTYDDPSGKRWQMVKTNLIAVWAGEKTVTVALEKIKPVPGQNWISPITGMKLVWIQQLGIWVGQTEVSNNEFKQFRPSHESGSFDGPDYGMDNATYKKFLAGLFGKYPLNAPDQPVQRVSFRDAIEYASWLTHQERSQGYLHGGEEFRLPTTAEWLFLAGSGGNLGREAEIEINEAYRKGIPIMWLGLWRATELPWPPLIGNFPDASMMRALRDFYPASKFASSYDDGYVVSCPVEMSGSNAFGLFGVTGNAAEWTLSDGAPNLSGGSWRKNQHKYDYGSQLGQADIDSGVRIVLVPQKEKPEKQVKPSIYEGAPFIRGGDWTEPGLGIEFAWVDALEAWVGIYEVRNREYASYDPAHSSGNGMDGDEQPAANMTYEDAVMFSIWLTSREKSAGRLPSNFMYRLPSETEWIILARCGDDRKYPWGNTWPPSYGNLGDKAFWIGKGKTRDLAYIKEYNDGFPLTCPVLESGANEWGIHGLVGNVSEYLLNGKTIGWNYVWPVKVSLEINNTSSLYNNPTASLNNVGFRLVLASNNEFNASGRVNEGGVSRQTRIRE